MWHTIYSCLRLSKYQSAGVRPRLSTKVVEIFNAMVTYSVKQLTTDYVDETSVHHGFNADNDYNIRSRTV